MSSHTTIPIGTSAASAGSSTARDSRDSIEVSYTGPRLASFAEHARNDDAFVRTVREMWLGEPGARGRVLDIGCGHAFPPALRGIESVCAQLDGVDPSAEVHEHPHLKMRWQAPLHEAPIPRHAYDMAYAYNVAEHISDPMAFLTTVRDILKPGGVFWALTPNGTHPFCMLSRTLEVAGLKGFFARRNKEVNEYPAYYRMNTPRQVLRAARGLGFSSARFVYLPSMSWHHYFPRPVRFLPYLFDRAVGLRVNRFKVVIAYRLEAGAKS